MKYRGLDPRTRLLRWSLFVVLIIIVVGGDRWPGARDRFRLAT